MKKNVAIFVVAALGLVVSSLLFFVVWLFLKPALDGHRTPVLAQNLPSNFRLGEETFQRRLNDTFPTGVEAETVINRLSEDGFDVDTSTQSASFSKFSFPCQFVWRVVWHTDENDGITDVKGMYGATCP